MSTFRITFALFFTVLLGAFAFAQEGVFTPEQAAAGQTVYQRSCAACHGENLQGAGHSPQLAGERFQNMWSDRTVGEVHDYVANNMPVGNEGSLSDQAYLDVTAFMLARNGSASGAEPFTNSETQAATTLVFGVADTNVAEAPMDSGSAEDNGTTTLIREVEEWDPVTMDRLLNPLDGDWVNHRRTVEGTSFSPLAEITDENVDSLRHMWAWASSDTENFQMVPVVANGVMFVNEHVSGSGRVIALDASNGDELWIYERSWTEAATGVQARGVFVYEDKVLWGTAGSTMVALDAKTGEELWASQSGDPRSDPRVGGYTSPPIVVNDVVIAGNSQGDFSARGRLDAFDVETGEILWQTYTTPDEGEEGFETWGSAEPNGATPWLPATYDAELGLIYIGTGQPLPWTPLLRGGGEGGHGDAALYSNNIIAVDVETGEFVWNYAVFPGEYWDYDTPFESVLIDAEIDGEPRKLLQQSNKGGWSVVLDRETGEFINAYQIATSNIVDHFTEDGQVVYNEDIVPTAEDVAAGNTFFTCPFINGARSTGAHSYSPETGLVYAAVVDNCSNMTYISTGMYGSNFTYEFAPDKDYLGSVKAMDPLTGEVEWQFIPETGASIVGGTLATSGGVVFVGTADRWFYGLDQETGEVLWQTRVNGDVGVPMTYAVDGKQFVAVAGNAGYAGTMFSNPLLGLPMPSGTGTIWSFALPETN